MRSLQDQVARIAEAATEAAGLHASSHESEPGQRNDEQDRGRAPQVEHKGQRNTLSQISEEKAKAARETARIAAAEEEAKREKDRLAAQKAEQERAQAEIARGMEAVREAALQRSILLSRIPRCQGQVLCQFNGKKDFVSIFLELADGVLRMNDGDAVLRKCANCKTSASLFRSQTNVVLRLTCGTTYARAPCVEQCHGRGVQRRRAQTTTQGPRERFSRGSSGLRQCWKQKVRAVCGHG